MYWDDEQICLSIFDDILYGDAYAMKMFLHLLYVHLKRTDDDVKKLDNAILQCQQLNKSIAKNLIIFCYNE